MNYIMQNNDRPPNQSYMINQLCAYITEQHKISRAVNFVDFAVSLQNAKIIFAKNSWTASHVAKLCLQSANFIFCKIKIF